MNNHSRQYYLARKNSGLCTRCWKYPAIENRTQCNDCLERGRVQAHLRRAQRKQNHLCSQCGKPISDNKARCHDCNEKYLNYRREFAEARKAQKLCVKCGDPVIDNHKMCVKCRDYYRKRSCIARLPLKAAIERDGFRCQICGCAEVQHLHAHHIDGKGRYNSKHPNDSLDNLITLCRRCHSSVSYLYHTEHLDVAIKLMQVFL